MSISQLIGVVERNVFVNCSECWSSGLSRAGKRFSFVVVWSPWAPNVEWEFSPENQFEDVK